MSKFYTETIDLDKFKSEFSRGSLGNSDSLHQCLYSSEQGQQAELKSFYDFVSNKTELSQNERKTQFKTLLTYLSRYSPQINIKLEEEDFSFPINQKSREFLEKVAKDKINERRLGIALATPALELADNKTPQEIKESLDKKIEEIHNHMLVQVQSDATRTNISFKKDGQPYFLEEAIPGIRQRNTGIKIQELKKGIIKLNKDKNLGLSGEQIDYTILCMDQAGMIGSPIFNVMPQYANKGLVAGNSPTESTFLIEIENNKVNVNCNNTFRGQTGEEETLAAELTLYTASADITALKKDSMKIGLASGHVPVTISFSSTFDPMEYAAPDSIKAKNKNYNHVAEYCRVKALSNRIETLDEQRELVATKTSPRLISNMISTISNIKKFNTKQTSELCSSVSDTRKLSALQTAELSASVSFASIKKGERLNLVEATDQLLLTVDGLDHKRARRYIQALADREKIPTNIGFGERVGNFFADTGDWLRGRTTPEKRLAPMDDLNSRSPKNESQISQESLPKRERASSKSAPMIEAPVSISLHRDNSLASTISISSHRSRSSSHESALSTAEATPKHKKQNTTPAKRTKKEFEPTLPLEKPHPLRKKLDNPPSPPFPPAGSPVSKSGSGKTP